MGADVNLRRLVSGSALYQAVRLGSKLIVELLINAVADEEEDSHQDDSMTTHTGNNHDRAEDDTQSERRLVMPSIERIVKILINSGADVNTRGGIHGSPLAEAIALGNDRTVRLLVNNGVTSN